LKSAWTLIGKVAFVLLWIYSLSRIDGPKDIIDIIWAAIMTLFIVAGIWAIFPRRPQFPKQPK
jgi:hypothetical protein